MLFIDQEMVFEKVANGVRAGRKFVFLLGSGVTAAREPSGLGVPMASGILKKLKSRLSGLAIDSYQDGFEKLSTLHSADAANELIRECVLEAYGGTKSPSLKAVRDLEELESDWDDWLQPDAMRALTTLIYMHPSCFGGNILTTNFDPLLEICLSRAGRPFHSTYVHDDGSLSYTRGSGVAITHLHGHWIGSDTLHTEGSLGQERPRLLSSLLRILGQDTTLIVLGYGGWTDVAMKAMSALIEGSAPQYDIIWCFHSGDKAGVRAAYPNVIRLMEIANRRTRGHCVLDVEADGLLTGLASKLAAINPGQDVRTFLDLETVARANRFYHWQGHPWGEESLGSSIKRLAAFGVRVAAAGALATVELELSNLELQPVHQAPSPRQHSWIRIAIGEAFEALQNNQTDRASEFEKLSLRAHQERLAIKDLEGRNREANVILAVDHALSATYAALSGSQGLADNGTFSAEVLAAKAAHVIWRKREEDEFILQHVKQRLTALGFNISLAEEN
jgi:SIR2-like domain